ncbi:MAG: Mrp/NBP35 family ATP-binding protein [Deltaproteobacteria bacterium]|nr:Mrp/NBP35 family ATP-binding protein [Deltaproteobacteria bacterium]
MQGVQVDDQRVKVQLALLAPVSAHREALLREVREAAESCGATAVDLEVTSQVRTRQTAGDDPCPEVKNVIPVVSGKGGVGKSTVATNLALALHRAGARVGLLDADIYGPSIPTMMGIMGRPVSRDGKAIEPLERFGMKIMSMGFLLEDPHTAVVWRGPMIQGALQQFLKDVSWGKLDYLILDLPPGTGDVALTLFQKVKVTGVVVVTTPQDVALMDVYKSVSMCQKLNAPVLGVVENMSYFIDSVGVRHELFGRGGGARVAEFAKAPLLGQVPMDSLVREWGDNGTPVVQAAPASPAARAFKDIAERVADRVTAMLFELYGGVAPTEGPRRLPIVR